MASSACRRSGSNRQAWRLWFTERMKAGREYCRMCGRAAWHVTQDRSGLRFGHIRAAAVGGGPGIANTTIVCSACDQVMGTGDWTGKVRPLSLELIWPPVDADNQNRSRRREHQAGGRPRPRQRGRRRR